MIRRLRTQRGLSVRGLAEQAGISASFLGAVECGESDIALGRLAQVAGSLEHDVASGRSVCGLAVGDYFEVTESNRLRIPHGKHFCLYIKLAGVRVVP